MTLSLLASALVGGGAGCRRPAANSGALGDAGEVPPALGTAAFVHSAIRCGECHGVMEAEWRSSAHAAADRSIAYRAMRADAGREGARCDRCHAPLRGLVPAANAAVAEGVGCDVCHTIAEVDPRREGAGFRLRIEDNVKYGALCGVPNHYFHRMGCASIFEQARYCAACHLLDERGLAVFTEYAEWEAGPWAQAGVPCQDCHMPSAPGEVAAGSPARAEVHHHGMLDRDGALRRRALSLVASIRETPGGLHADLVVKNVRAGHSVPSGLPGHEIVLRVRALDAGGRETARAERVYARRLLDASGAEAPFDRAVRAGTDDRIGPKESRTEAFDLAAPPAAGELRVDLVRRALSPALSARLGLAPSPEEPLLEARIAFGPPRGGGGRRAGLPATVERRP